MTRGMIPLVFAAVFATGRTAGHNCSHPPGWRILCCFTAKLSPLRQASEED